MLALAKVARVFVCGLQNRNTQSPTPERKREFMLERKRENSCLPVCMVVGLSGYVISPCFGQRDTPKRRRKVRRRRRMQRPPLPRQRCHVQLQLCSSVQWPETRWLETLGGPGLGMEKAYVPPPLRGICIRPLLPSNQQRRNYRATEEPRGFMSSKWDSVIEQLFMVSSH